MQFLKLFLKNFMKYILYLVMIYVLGILPFTIALWLFGGVGFFIYLLYIGGLLFTTISTVMNLRR